MGSYSYLLCAAIVWCLSNSACGSAMDAAPHDANCGDGINCAMWIQDYQREVVSKITGHSPIAENVTIPSRFTPAERKATADYIAAELTRFGLQVERHEYGTGTNIIATLAATRADARLILLGGHYDGVEDSPAAGDDGTGVALVLSAARYFQSQSQRDNEMIFAFFDEEEDGLIGSQAYAAKMRAEHPELAAVHIFDLISWDDDGDGAVELWSPSPALEALYRSVGDTRGVTVHAVEFESSDHAAFIGSGFSSVGVSEEFVSGDFNPHYHTADDSYENVDFDYLEGISKLAFEVTAKAQ